MNSAVIEIQDERSGTALDESKLNHFVQKILGEMGAATSAALVIMGDKLGLYRALAGSEGLTPWELSEQTSTNERYVREWLSAQAAADYVSYSPETGRFYLRPEQAEVFANPESPAALAGGFYSVGALFVDEPKVSEAFRTGQGVPWGEHSDCLFCGTEKFFRPGYAAHLTNEWIPALPGVREKLEAGARVADVGCGHGASTIIMAKAFPNSTFFGFDVHEPSIVRARQLAGEEGLSNVSFAAVPGKSIPDGDYDLIAFFDCVHDMGDPVGALKQARRKLKEDGCLLIVEPFAHDDLEDNFNPVGRLYFGFSTMVCTPASLSQEVGLGLGAQAGPKRLRQVIHAGGFSQVRVAMETPFNLIIEARP